MQGPLLCPTYFIVYISDHLYSTNVIYEKHIFKEQFRSTNEVRIKTVTFLRLHYEMIMASKAMRAMILSKKILKIKHIIESDVINDKLVKPAVKRLVTAHARYANIMPCFARACVDLSCILSLCDFVCSNVISVKCVVK